MESFNKYEITGIVVSILVVVLFFATARFFSFDSIDPESVFTRDTASNPIQLPADLHSNAAETVEIVREGVSQRGDVTELIVQDVREGEGRTVREGDTVTVQYIGVLETGEEFDNSYARGSAFTFTVGAGEVIEGWDVGIVGMKVGGERILIIPADMAYGNRTIGSIPPNAALLFAIELLRVE